MHSNLENKVNLQGMHLTFAHNNKQQLCRGTQTAYIDKGEHMTLKNCGSISNEIFYVF